MVSRRLFLRGGALALTGAVLAACGGQPLPTPVVATPTPAPAKAPEAPKPTEAAKPAAAAATEAPKPAQPASAAPGTVQLRMHARVDAEGKKPAAAIAVLHQRNPKVQIVEENIPGGEFTTKILAMAAGGQLGDLIWGSPNNYHIQVGNGLWFDVYPLVRSKN